MERDFLQRIGFTPGEQRVYLALAKLGKTTSGPLIDESAVSSSKIYHILERLIRKGLVSETIRGGVREFQTTNPYNIKELLKREETRLKELQTEADAFIKQFKTLMVEEEETARIYRGFRGVRSAQQNIVDELEQGEEYLFFSVEKEKLTDKRIVLFYQNLHTERQAKDLKVKGIFDNKLKTLAKKRWGTLPDMEIRFFALTLPQALTIGKHRILIESFDIEPLAIEIISTNIARKYREFFRRVWKEAET